MSEIIKWEEGDLGADEDYVEVSPIHPEEVKKFLLNGGDLTCIMGEEEE